MNKQKAEGKESEEERGNTRIKDKMPGISPADGVLFFFIFSLKEPDRVPFVFLLPTNGEWIQGLRV